MKDPMQSMYEFQMSKLPQEFKDEWEKHINQFDYNAQGKATELVYFLEFVQARKEIIELLVEDGYEVDLTNYGQFVDNWSEDLPLQYKTMRINRVIFDMTFF